MLVSSIFFVSTLIYSTLGYAVPQSPQPSSVAPPDLKDPKILDALLSYSERPTVPADDTSSGGDVFTMASAGSAECYRSGWHAHRDRLIDVVTRFCNQNGGLGVPNDYPPGVFMSEYQGEINGRPLVINTGYRNTHGSGTWMIRTDECKCVDLCSSLQDSSHLFLAVCTFADVRLIVFSPS